MRVSLPHMGNLYIPFKSIFQKLNIDYVIPPLNSRRTLSLGVKYSPEGLCIPFKLVLGNLIEAANSGADTMLVPGGNGICRLGYYARIQEQILHDLGHKNIRLVEVVVSNDKLSGPAFIKMIKSLSYGDSWPKVTAAVRFGLSKLSILDRLERVVQRVRAVELAKGTANRLFAETIKAIDQAEDFNTLKRIEAESVERLNQIARDSQARPLIVGVIGEFYVLLEPFSNFDIESELGKLGVEVRRTLFTSGWTRVSLFPKLFKKNEKDLLYRAASPYLKHDIGGEGWESVGEKVLHAKEYDGIIHLAPFTCMPEIVAQNIMTKTREEIPVLPIICDEQMAKAGLITRLEAFVDLLARKRRTKYNN